MDQKIIKFLRVFTYVMLFATIFIVFFPLDQEFAKIVGMPSLAGYTFNDLYFLYITSKGFIFRTLVEAGFASWLILMIMNKECRPKKNIILYAFTAFLVIMFVADLFAINPTKAFWSNFERMEGWFLIFHLYLYFIVLSSVLKTKELWRRFLTTSVFVSFALSLYAIFQLVTGSDGGPLVPSHFGDARVDATIGNPIYFAVYLLIHIFIAGYLWYGTRDRKTWLKWFYPAIMIFEVFIMLKTQTRGAMVGLVFGILAILIILAIKERKSNKIKYTAIGLLVASAVLVAVAFGIRNTEFVANSPTLQRATSVFNGGSYFARMNIWNMALQGFADRPILGAGQEGFNYVFADHFKPEMYGQEAWFDRAHNVYLDWLVAGGLLGFLGYLSLFFTAFWVIWTKRGHTNLIEKTLLSGMLVAYMIFNLSVFDQLISYMMFTMILAYLGATSVHNHKKEFIWNRWSNTTENEIRSWYGYTIGVGMIIFVIMFYNFIYKPINTCKTLVNSLSALGVRDFNGAYEQIKKAYAYDTGYLQEISETVGIRGSGIVVGLKKDQKKALEAEVLFRKILSEQRDLAPKDPRSGQFYGQFLAELGMLDESLTYFKEAMENSPNKQIPMIQYSNILLLSGKKQEAYDLAKKAYELDISKSEIRDVYVLISALTGKTDVAIEIGRDDFLNKPLTDRMVRAFIDAGKIDSLIQLLRSELKKNPKANQTRANLISTYAIAGDKWTAIAELEKFKEVVPEQTPYFDAKIKEIRDAK